jgi:glycosyltransferase 2 family protein
MKKYIVRTLTIAFFGVVAYLLYERINAIDFQEVQSGFEKISSQFLMLLSVLVFINYFILANFDYLGFRFLKINFMHYLRVLMSAFICYAFTLNIGAFIGGMGFRFRIYTGWKVPRKKIPPLILFSTVSNWLGYTLLAAILFVFHHQKIHNLVPLPSWMMISIGTMGLFIVVTYFYLCHREYVGKVKTMTFPFPKMKIAFLQLSLSILQWGLLSSIIYIILLELGAKIEFEQVLFTFLLASIAGVITHIPAGLGVLETIFLKMESDVRDSDMLVALICFRVIYYLIPLAFAIPSYFLVELYQKKKISSLS